MAKESLIDDVIRIAQDASQAILAVYHQTQGFDVHTKSDQSPITQADMTAHRVIKAGLATLTPDIPVLSEESAEIPFDVRSKWPRYWLVDPLDGTKEFIARNDDFSINIALIQDHQPVLGLIYVPVTEHCYFASQGNGAFKSSKHGQAQPIQTTMPKPSPTRLVASRRHGKAAMGKIISRLGDCETLHRGSALKMCLIAEGEADVYPRFGPTCEWDTGAGQCILEEAGGALINAQTFEPLRYNTQSSLINPDFIAIGDTQFDWQPIFKEVISQ